jgi:hypothetical protein
MIYKTKRIVLLFEILFIPAAYVTRIRDFQLQLLGVITQLTVGIDDNAKNDVE